MPDPQDVPKTGPEAIRHALANLDMNALVDQAKADLKSGKKTKRKGAVAILNIAEGLKRTESTPTDFLITKVPVIPAKYRPYSAMGGTFIPGDANILYKDLMDLKDAHEEEKNVFGENGAGQSRLALYDAVRSVYGYGEPVKDKTRQKGVQGFLRKVVGGTSKHSYWNRKVLSKTQDNVGRSTIIVDPELKINQIGIPTSMAFKMYAPYIQRQMVRSGFKPVDAVKSIAAKDKNAKHALERVIENHPVFYSRAPAWHRFNLLGGMVKLRDDNAIAINPLTTSGLAGDFDGNCIIGSSKLIVKIPNSLATTDSDLSKLLIKQTTNDHTADFDELILKVLDNNDTFCKTGAVMKITASTKLLVRTESHSVLSMEIENFPRTITSGRLDKNGATVFDVPEGVEVLTTSADGKGARWSCVESFTIEGGCDVVKLTTSRGKVVSISTNESVAVYDADLGLKKVKPQNALEHLVPVIKQVPSLGNLGDYEYGWFIGAFISDGWITDTTLGYAKESPDMRAKFIACLASAVGNAAIKDHAKTYTEYHESSSNWGIGGTSIKLHIQLTKLPEDLIKTLRSCYVGTQTDTRACLRKQLPNELLFKLSEEARVGLLAGLIDGDGSMAINNSKKKAQVLCNFCTSSPSLKESVLTFFKLLGISYSVSETHPKAGRVQKHINYTISISVPDLVRYVTSTSIPLNLRSEYDAPVKLLKEGVGCSNKDIVPVPVYILDGIRETASPELLEKCSITYSSLYSAKSKAKGRNYTPLMRNIAKKYMVCAATLKIENPNFWDAFRLCFDQTTTWEFVKEVVSAPSELVYDIGVPETKVFALEDGLVIYDTINVHVPSTPSAIKDVKEKLMPSANPFSSREWNKITNAPKQEQILGLYTANVAPAKAKHTFNTEDEALEAIRKGQVALSDEVEIGYPTTKSAAYRRSRYDLELEDPEYEDMGDSYGEWPPTENYDLIDIPEEEIPTEEVTPETSNLKEILGGAGILAAGGASLGTYLGTATLGDAAKRMRFVGEWGAANANDIVNKPEVGAKLIDMYSSAAKDLQDQRLGGGIFTAGDITEKFPPSALVGREFKTFADGTKKELNTFEKALAMLGILPGMDPALRKEMQLAKNHYSEFNAGRGSKALIREGLGRRDAKAMSYDVDPELVKKYGWDKILKVLHVPDDTTAEEALKGMDPDLYRDSIGKRLGTIFVGGGTTPSGQHWGSEDHGKLDMTPELQESIAKSTGPAQYTGFADLVNKYGRPALLGAGGVLTVLGLYKLYKALQKDDNFKSDEELIIDPEGEAEDEYYEELEKEASVAKEALAEMLRTAKVRDPRTGQFLKTVVIRDGESVTMDPDKDVVLKS